MMLLVCMFCFEEESLYPVMEVEQQPQMILLLIMHFSFLFFLTQSRFETFMRSQNYIARNLKMEFGLLGYLRGFELF
jgi:hypothetical protein